MRTADLADPGAWRAWDGRDFTVRFLDPYRSAAVQPERHTCAPVGRGRLTMPVGSVVRHRATGLYVAVMTDRRRIRPDRPPVAGIFAATSPDLIHWSEPRLVLATPTLHHWTCLQERQPVHYPALLDEDSRSRNFEDTDGTAWLYLTRFNPQGCRLGADRDLIRLPVRITPVRP